MHQQMMRNMQNRNINPMMMQQIIQQKMQQVRPATPLHKPQSNSAPHRAPAPAHRTQGAADNNNANSQN